jgi:hypothetical protein
MADALVDRCDRAALESRRHRQTIWRSLASAFRGVAQPRSPHWVYITDQAGAILAYQIVSIRPEPASRFVDRTGLLLGLLTHQNRGL